MATHEVRDQTSPQDEASSLALQSGTPPESRLQPTAAEPIILPVTFPVLPQIIVYNSPHSTVTTVVDSSGSPSNSSSTANQIPPMHTEERSGYYVPKRLAHAIAALLVIIVLLCLGSYFGYSNLFSLLKSLSAFIL